MSELTPTQAGVLLAVHRFGTTIEAARAFNLTQSAISKIVARSEASLGVPVFARRDGRLVLRSEARELMASLGAVETEWRNLQDTVADLRSGRALPLRIAATPSIGQGLVAGALRRLLATHPDARAELIMGNPVAELSNGTADIGFMFSPRVSDDIALTPLAEGSIVALVRKDDPLAAQGSVDLAELAGRRLLCFDRESSPLGWLIAKAHEEAGLDYAPFMTAPYSITVAHLLARDGDVSLVDSMLFEAQRFDGLVQLQITPRIPITICMMTARSRPLSHLAARMVEIITGG